MAMKASDGGARGSRRVFGHRLARLAGCAAVSMVGVALAAAPALADKIEVLTNTSRFLTHSDNTDAYGPIPQYRLQAELTTSSDGVHTLTITNPSSNASVGRGRGIITGAELDGPGGATVSTNTDCCVVQQYLESNDAFLYQQGGNMDVEGDPAPGFCSSDHAPGDVAICEFAGEDYKGEAVNGILPGQSRTITYKTDRGNPGLYRLEEHFDFNDQATQCRPKGYGNEAKDPGASPFGATAAGSCKVPATPKIDDVNIDRQKHTAQFHQKAKGATGFTCELLRNNRLLFLHSCGAKKWYANPLKRGTYVYLVWAGNRAGRSKSAAFMNFKLK